MRIAVALVAVVALAGCATTETFVAQAKRDFVGKPIAERYQTLGAPETVVRTSPNEISHTWARSQTTVSGGGATIIPYVGGATVIQNSSYGSSTTCRATYVTRATSDTTPLYQQTIVDVRSPGCN